MAYSGNNPQFSSIYASILSYKQWAAGTLDLDRGWGEPLAVFEQMNNASSFNITGPEGKLISWYQPRQEVVQQIATATQSGTNLILTWADPTFTGFREKDYIMDDTMNKKALVVSASQGAVTIQPVGYPTTLTAGTDFVVASYAYALFDASGNLASPVGKTNLFKERVPRYNYTALTRDSLTLGRREKFTSFKGPDGGAYFWNSNEEELVKRFKKNLLKKYVFSDPAQFSSQLEGLTNTTQGLRAAIRDQGGMFVQSTSLLSQTMFETYLDFLSTKSPDQNQEYWFWGGRAAWGRISSFYTNQLTYTVSTKLSNGNSLNFDVREVTIKGITLKFMNGAIFNDNVMFPALSSIAGASGTKMSNTFALLNMSPIPDADTGMMIPACRKFHWGNNAGGGEIIFKGIPGMTGPGEGDTTGPASNGGYQWTSNAVDGFAIEIEVDNGIDFTADGCVWFELAA